MHLHFTCFDLCICFLFLCLFLETENTDFNEQDSSQNEICDLTYVEMNKNRCVVKFCMYTKNRLLEIIVQVKYF